MEKYFTVLTNCRQARAKLPKKRRRVVNVDLPQAATNRNRTRGAGGSGGPKGGKSGMGQKMGESKHVFFLKTQTYY